MKVQLLLASLATARKFIRPARLLVRLWREVLRLRAELEAANHRYAYAEGLEAWRRNNACHAAEIERLQLELTKAQLATRMERLLVVQLDQIDRILRGEAA